MFFYFALKSKFSEFEFVFYVIEQNLIDCFNLIHTNEQKFILLF